MFYFLIKQEMNIIGILSQSNLTHKITELALGATTWVNVTPALAENQVKVDGHTITISRDKVKAGDTINVPVNESMLLEKWTNDYHDIQVCLCGDIVYPLTINFVDERGEIIQTGILDIDDETQKPVLKKKWGDYYDRINDYSMYVLFSNGSKKFLEKSDFSSVDWWETKYCFLKPWDRFRDQKIPDTKEGLAEFVNTNRYPMDEKGVITISTPRAFGTVALNLSDVWPYYTVEQLVENDKAIEILKNNTEFVNAFAKWRAVENLLSEHKTKNNLTNEQILRLNQVSEKLQKTINDIIKSKIQYAKMNPFEIISPCILPDIEGIQMDIGGKTVIVSEDVFESEIKKAKDEIMKDYQISSKSLREQDLDGIQKWWDALTPEQKSQLWKLKQAQSDLNRLSIKYPDIKNDDTYKRFKKEIDDAIEVINKEDQENFGELTTHWITQPVGTTTFTIDWLKKVKDWGEKRRGDAGIVETMRFYIEKFLSAYNDLLVYIQQCNIGEITPPTEEDQSAYLEQLFEETGNEINSVVEDPKVSDLWPYITKYRQIGKQRYRYDSNLWNDFLSAIDVQCAQWEQRHKNILLVSPMLQWCITLTQKDPKEITVEDIIVGQKYVDALEEIKYSELDIGFKMDLSPITNTKDIIGAYNEWKRIANSFEIWKFLEKCEATKGKAQWVSWSEFIIKEINDIKWVFEWSENEELKVTNALVAQIPSCEKRLENIEEQIEQLKARAGKEKEYQQQQEEKRNETIKNIRDLINNQDWSQQDVNRYQEISQNIGPEDKMTDADGTEKPISNIFILYWLWSRGEAFYQAVENYNDVKNEAKKIGKINTDLSEGQTLSTLMNTEVKETTPASQLKDLASKIKDAVSAYNQKIKSIQEEQEKASQERVKKFKTLIAETVDTDYGKIVELQTSYKALTDAEKQQLTAEEKERYDELTKSLTEHTTNVNTRKQKKDSLLTAYDEIQEKFTPNLTEYLQSAKISQLREDKQEIDSINKIADPVISNGNTLGQDTAPLAAERDKAVEQANAIQGAIYDREIPQKVKEINDYVASVNKTFNNGGNYKLILWSEQQCNEVKNYHDEAKKYPTSEENLKELDKAIKNLDAIGDKVKQLESDIQRFNDKEHSSDELNAKKAELEKDPGYYSIISKYVKIGTMITEAEAKEKLAQTLAEEQAAYQANYNLVQNYEPTKYNCKDFRRVTDAYFKLTEQDQKALESKYTTNQTEVNKLIGEWNSVYDQLNDSVTIALSADKSAMLKTGINLSNQLQLQKNIESLFEKHWTAWNDTLRVVKDKYEKDKLQESDINEWLSDINKNYEAFNKIVTEGENILNTQRPSLPNWKTIQTASKEELIIYLGEVMDLFNKVSKVEINKNLETTYNVFTILIGWHLINADLFPQWVGSTEWWASENGVCIRNEKNMERKASLLSTFTFLIGEINTQLTAIENQEQTDLENIKSQEIWRIDSNVKSKNPGDYSNKNRKSIEGLADKGKQAVTGAGNAISVKKIANACLQGIDNVPTKAQEAEQKTLEKAREDAQNYYNKANERVIDSTMQEWIDFKNAMGRLDDVLRDKESTASQLNGAVRDVKNDKSAYDIAKQQKEDAENLAKFEKGVEKIIAMIADEDGKIYGCQNERGNTVLVKQIDDIEIAEMNFSYILDGEKIIFCGYGNSREYPLTMRTEENPTTAITESIASRVYVKWSGTEHPIIEFEFWMVGKPYKIITADWKVISGRIKKSEMDLSQLSHWVSLFCVEWYVVRVVKY